MLGILPTGHMQQIFIRTIPSHLHSQTHHFFFDKLFEFIGVVVSDEVQHLLFEGGFEWGQGWYVSERIFENERRFSAAWGEACPELLIFLAGIRQIHNVRCEYNGRADQIGRFDNVPQKIFSSLNSTGQEIPLLKNIQKLIFKEIIVIRNAPLPLNFPLIAQLVLYKQAESEMRILTKRVAFLVSQRVRIEPEHCEIEPFDDWFKVTSPTYEFLIKKQPPTPLIYTHRPDTPASIMLKSAIHILPESLPDLNRSQKWSALSKKLDNNYQNSFKNCKTPKQIFHLQRRIKSDMRSKLYFIGTLEGKYKHLRTFRSMLELAGEKTQREYMKKGVKVEAINGTIYPMGVVWMPTSERYFQDYLKILNQLERKDRGSMLDLGCGSGILSFLFAKHNKKWTISALDDNPAAISTTNINASKLNLPNIQSFEFDILDQDKFQIKTLQFQLPKTFDFITINPPWMVASKLEGQSIIADGVYDKDGQILENSIKLGKRLLSKDGKIVVIYSDLSVLIGLTDKTVESMAEMNKLAVVQKYEMPLQQELGKKSALQEYKSKAKILTYVLGHK